METNKRKFVDRSRLRTYSAREITYAKRGAQNQSDKVLISAKVLQTEPKLKVLKNDHLKVKVRNMPLPSKAKKPLFKQKKSWRKLLTKTNIIFLLIALALVAVIVSNIQNISTKKTIEEKVKADSQPAETTPAQTNSPRDVDENPVNDDQTYSYTVDPAKIRYIRIAKIGVFSRVIEVGKSASNEVLTPKSIYDAGWYNQSNLPGENGAVFINGHVSGPNYPGIFKKLKNLAFDDIIELEKGDGSTYSYKVMQVYSTAYQSVNMAELLTSADTDVQGLNIMTCGGEFDWGKNEYKDRVIVRAIKI